MDAPEANVAAADRSFRLGDFLRNQLRNTCEIARTRCVLLGIRALLARRSPELGGPRTPIVASPS